MSETLFHAYRSLRKSCVTAGDKMSPHPYERYGTHPIWKVLEAEIGALVANKDLVETTPRQYIVGALCKALDEAGFAAERSPFEPTKPRVPLPLDLAQLWEEWANTPRPVLNFNADNVHALTYGIECDLEHQAGYLEGMLEALSSGNHEWNFPMRAGAELRDLNDFVDRLRSLELGEEVEAPYLQYADVVTRLLASIIDRTEREAPGSNS